MLLYNQIMAHFKSVDEYIAGFDGITKERLLEMRALVKKLLPGAEERISYNIPAYFVDKKLIIYYAGFKNHIGMYPGRTNSDAYNKLAANYAHGKSTAQFPHTEALPVQIITDFVKVRLAETSV
jgi:uncharacterized protein YdhG (YjbR/CyaY superfamily)